MARMQQEQFGELERLKLQGAMSPDQLLAIQAGLSPEVAKIFAERARADGVQAEQKESILREMVDMARQGSSDTADRVQSVVDIAFRRVSGPGPVGSGELNASIGSTSVSGEQTECSSCHHRVPVSDRFCKVCGKQMRS